MCAVPAALALETESGAPGAAQMAYVLSAANAPVSPPPATPAPSLSDPPPPPALPPAAAPPGPPSHRATLCASAAPHAFQAADATLREAPRHRSHPPQTRPAECCMPCYPVRSDRSATIAAAQR